MKTITTEMASHLAQEVTTLCTCWKIVRTDGEVFGFTDHDLDIEFDGVVYESETGYNRTAIRSDASMSVDNLDVTGVLESDRISENDLRNGVFDFAAVFIFAVNWADLSQEEIRLRRGWFGEVTLNQNGLFETEIRGLHQALNFNFMESYQPECRADFCDTRCGKLYADYTRDGFLYDWISPTQFVISYGDPGAVTVSVGAHRYWRVLVETLGPATDDGRAAFAELRFFDQDHAEIIGGTASASTGTGASARDNNSASDWTSNSAAGVGAWVKVDFGTPKDVAKFRIQAPDGSDFDRTPVGFKLQYSDDNAAWTDADSYTTPEWLTPSEVRTFVAFSALSLNAFPVPEAGADTYNFGTIKFTSGDNTGKTIEIVDFDEATGVVTMFESFPFGYVIGDTLELVQGCDKIFDTCKLYDNVDNFRGEPHVPGQDEFMRYPDAHD